MNVEKMSIIPNSKNPFECCPFTRGSVSNTKEQAEYLNSLFGWKESAEGHVYTAHIRGLNQDQVKVEIEYERLLKISAEKVVKQVEHDGEIKSSRIKFIKTYELPHNAETDRVKAYLENGVLNVTVAKKNEDKAIDN